MKILFFFFALQNIQMIYNVPTFYQQCGIIVKMDKLSEFYDFIRQTVGWSRTVGEIIA